MHLKAWLWHLLHQICVVSAKLLLFLHIICLKDIQSFG